jgi:hypothetical protein
MGINSGNDVSSYDVSLKLNTSCSSNARHSSPCKSPVTMSQSGVTVEKAGAPFTVVNDLPRSSPGAKQALVKSVYVALNPV